MESCGLLHNLPHTTRAVSPLERLVVVGTLVHVAIGFSARAMVFNVLDGPRTPHRN